MQDPVAPKTPPDRKLPQSLLVSILYASHAPWASWDSLTCTLQIGPLARHLGLRNWQVKESLDWLASKSYISTLQHTYGQSRFDIRLPEPILRLLSGDSYTRQEIILEQREGPSKPR